MHFVPLAAVVGPMLFTLPLTFAQHLDAGAINQKVQRLASVLVSQCYLQVLLASAQGAEIRNTPVQSRPASANRLLTMPVV